MTISNPSSLSNVEKQTCLIAHFGGLMVPFPSMPWNDLIMLWLKTWNGLKLVISLKMAQIQTLLCIPEETVISTEIISGGPQQKCLKKPGIPIPHFLAYKWNQTTACCLTYPNPTQSLYHNLQLLYPKAPSYPRCTHH